MFFKIKFNKREFNKRGLKASFVFLSSSCREANKNRVIFVKVNKAQIAGNSGKGAIV
jgi:hypothetical protein